MIKKKVQGRLYFKQIVVRRYRVVIPIYKERLLTNEIIKTLIVAHWIDFLKFLFLFQLETTF